MCHSECHYQYIHVSGYTVSQQGSITSNYVSEWITATPIDNTWQRVSTAVHHITSYITYVRTYQCPPGSPCHRRFESTPYLHNKKQNVTPRVTHYWHTLPPHYPDMHIYTFTPHTPHTHTHTQTQTDRQTDTHTHQYSVS